MAQLHKCGSCGQTFSTEKGYLNHICPTTGFKPIQGEHQGESFKAISEAALKRGEDRKKKK